MITRPPAPTSRAACQLRRTVRAPHQLVPATVRRDAVVGGVDLLAGGEREASGSREASAALAVREAPGADVSPARIHGRERPARMAEPRRGD